MRGAGGIAGGGQIIGVALQKGPDGPRIAFSEALPDDGGAVICHLSCVRVHVNVSRACIMYE